MKKFPRSILKNVAALLIGAALVALMLGGSELVFGYLTRLPRERVQLRQEDLFVDDPAMGYVLRPDAKVLCRGLMGNNEIFAKTYSIDRLGRRTTPIEGTAAREFFAIFFGCSFTMGEGCNDDETLPYYLGKKAPAYQPYNYGVRGYGPQHMLYLLQHRDLRPEVTQQEGICVYVWIPDHLNRAIGAMPGFNYKNRAFPCYALNGGGGVVLEGTFEAARPWRSFLYDLVWKSRTLRYFQVNLPLARRDDDYQLAAAIIAQSAELFKVQFAESGFYVLFYYTAMTDKDERLMKLLDKSGVNYLAPGISRDIHRQLKYPDGHPTPEENAIVAQTIVDKLGLAPLAPNR